MRMLSQSHGTNVIVFAPPLQFTNLTEIKLKLILGKDLIDILFIDGDHTLYGVASDIKIYTKYVRPGGMVIFHDCGDIKALSTDLNSFKTIKSVRSAFDDFSYGKKKLIVQEHWGVGIVWVQPQNLQRFKYL